MARRVASPKGAKKKADTLFSLIVRAHGSCENPDCHAVCACEDRPRRHDATCPLQCAHIISRRFSATRTDLRNAICLCARCHHYWTDHPYEWAELVDDVQGAGVYDDLRRDAEQITKIDWPAEVERLTAIATERGVL